MFRLLTEVTGFLMGDALGKKVFADGQSQDKGHRSQQVSASRPVQRSHAPYLKTRVLLRRFLAFWLDYVLILIAGSLLDLWRANSTAGLLTCFAVFLAYRVVCEAYGGRTFSKMLLRLRVIRRDDPAAGVGLLRSFARNALAPVDHSLVVSLIGLILPLATEGNRRLGDLAAGTLVVSEGSLRAVLGGRSSGARGQSSPASTGARPGRNLSDKIAAERAVERIADELNKLPRQGGYFVFSAVPYNDGATMDYLVAGPCGLVVIKTSPEAGDLVVEDGRMMLDGRPLEPDPHEALMQECSALHESMEQLAASSPHARHLELLMKDRGISWVYCMPRAKDARAAGERPSPRDRQIASSVNMPDTLGHAIFTTEELIPREEVHALAQGIESTYGLAPAARPRTTDGRPMGGGKI